MSSEFIHVAEAKRLIGENISSLPPVKMLLENAAGMVLAEDIFSKTDIPPFNQSSMDGYALNFEGLKTHENLEINGEVPAGSGTQFTMPPQNAIRIFTGAPVPEGADTVVMQEKVKVIAKVLQVDDPKLTAGSNVRMKGSEIRSGDLAMKKNTLLSPAAAGFISGAGINEVLVYPRPAVSIILTGDELCKPGEPLKYGQVYESNSYSLLAALKLLHIDGVKVYTAEDRLETLIKVLNEALEHSDAVLLTGGVSVGDYDFVVSAASANGVSQIFHKIRQKPGKPFYFGKKENKSIFGLPGNPASVLSCFYEYVLPALGRMSNHQSELVKLMVPSSEKFIKTSGLSQFLKGFYDGAAVSQLNAQESFRLSSFAKANCLILLDADRTEYSAGELVEIHLLPSS